MTKTAFKPGTMLNPVPAVMVSCGKDKPNIVTVAWTGIVNSEPPMTYISLRKERYSHGIISREKEFVINLTTKDLAFATDWCGVRSGRDCDKWKEQNLTPQQSRTVGCTGIEESPVNIECRVTQVLELGSHDMFLAEIVAVTVDEGLIDADGSLRLDRAGLIAYNHGHYYPLDNRELGRFGFSVMKPRTRKRYEAQKRGRNRDAHRGADKRKRQSKSGGTRNGEEKEKQNRRKGR